MAQIHPNDIGLATFADVGNVEKLRTSAKSIVDAINELYQNDSNSLADLGRQLYVDGENNIILGQNNTVYGNNNLIIGSNNVVVGDNINLIQSDKNIYTSSYYSTDYYDVDSGKIYVNSYDGESVSFPLHVGDRVIVSVYISWATPEWDDWTYVETENVFAEISEVDESQGYITVNGLNISSDPPDDTHTVMESSYVSTFIVLNDEYKVAGNREAVICGNLATGKKSITFNCATASGSNSFAANYATAKGSNSSAFGSSNASGKNSFSAGGNCTVMGENAVALNYSHSYSPNSTSLGYYTRACGRPLKCTSLNWTNKSLTIASGENVNGIKEGTQIILRAYNSINTILFSTVTVKSVSGNVIYMADDTYTGGAGSYRYTLFPDGYIFVIDSSTSYANSDLSGGYYSIASGKYSLAYGCHVCAVHEGSAILGKYGFTDSTYSFAVANGTSVKETGLAFKVLSDGSVHADSEYTSPCADYAEFFEWADGNPDNEDRVGYFVKLENGKIIKCSDFDTPLGVVSATPAIIGDSGEMHWQGKFVTDDFGRVQYHDVVVPTEKGEDGNIIVEEHTESQPVINPDWNNEEEYIPRKDRPEWSAVGVLGKLVVYDDGTLKAGDICQSGKDGKAVKAIKNGYTVLKRVADDKVLIWFKG